MTAADRAELKRVAEEALSSRGKLGPQIEAEQTFHISANPSVVLALLSEIEGLRAEREDWKAEWEAVCSERIADRAKTQEVINERDKWIVELIQERDALRTQAPDSWRPDREARVIEPDNDFILKQAKTLSACKSEDAVKSLAWNIRVYHLRLLDRAALAPSADQPEAEGA